MSKVIKAHSARLLPAEKAHKAPAQADTATAEPGHEEYPSVYDEVLEAAQEEVALLIEDARREARGIIAEADQQAEDAREKARLEGYEQGHSDGYAGGFAQAGQELSELLARGQAEADATVNAAYEARDKLLSDMEVKIYRLALDIAEKIIGMELEQNNETYLSIVRTAIEAVQNETRVTLHINAAEYMSVFGAKDNAEIDTENGGVQTNIVIDPSVEPGGCLIETENGYIDASPSAQLEQIAFNLGIET